MMVHDDVCAVVLAAGLGTRLRPLTTILPKALVPVGNVPLLDRALHRLAASGFAGADRVAVNAHHHVDQVFDHVGDRAHLSLERDAPLGSAGALGHLRRWIDGRHVLVLNVDAYVSSPPDDLINLLADWDGRTVRMFGHRWDDGHPPFDGLAFAGASLLPAADVAALKDELSHLVLTTWRPAERAGRLQAISLDGIYVDCGTPADYLAANLHAASGENVIAEDATVNGTVVDSVIGARSVVHGSVRRCVLWPDATVQADEMLVDSVRVGEGLTVKATST